MKSNLICILFLAEHLNFVPIFAAVSLNTGIMVRQVSGLPPKTSSGKTIIFLFGFFHAAPRSNTGLQIQIQTEQIQVKSRNKYICKKTCTLDPAGAGVHRNNHVGKAGHPPHVLHAHLSVHLCNIYSPTQPLYACQSPTMLKFKRSF